MESFRILTVCFLIISPSLASVADQGPQTFEHLDTKKRETQNEATYPILLAPTHQQLQRPQPTQQTQYEIRYQPETNTKETYEEPKYFTPNSQYRPQLHFVPLEAMEQFIHQHAAPPSEQKNVQKSYYSIQSPQSDAKENNQREEEKEQRGQAQLQQRLKQQQQHEKLQLELEQEIQQQQILQQQIGQQKAQQEQFQRQQHQQQQALENQLKEQETQQKIHTQYFNLPEPNLQLVPYQPQQLFYEPPMAEYQQQSDIQTKNQQSHQFTNIQYIAQAPTSQAQKPHVLQYHFLPSEQQGRQRGNDFSSETYPRYAANIAAISEEIEKSKLKAAARAEAIARSPPVVVNKNVQITRHRPVEITKHVQVPVATPISVPIPTPFQINVPQPFAVPIEIVRPFAVPIVQTQTVEVDRPVPFEVEKRVPYEVEKKVYYKVDRPVPFDKVVRVEVTREIPVEVPIHKPEKLEIVRHVWEKKGLF